MLVDQHFSRGVDVTFFGRRCKANPAIARLARQFDCPVVGVRVIRLPGSAVPHRRRRPADAAARRSGRVDVAAATQMITIVVEGWVREYPGPVAVVPSALAVSPREARPRILTKSDPIRQLAPGRSRLTWRGVTTLRCHTRRCWQARTAARAIAASTAPDRWAAEGTRTCVWSPVSSSSSLGPPEPGHGAGDTACPGQHRRIVAGAQDVRGATADAHCAGRVGRAGDAAGPAAV